MENKDKTMAKKQVSEIIQLQNLKDFRKQYLSFDKRIDCEKIHSSDNETAAGFLEINRLGQMDLKEAHLPAIFERRNFYSIVVLTRGNMNVQIGLQSFQLNAPSLYFIASNQLHRVHKCTSDIQGYHLIFDDDYYLMCLHNQSKLNNFDFFMTSSVPVMALQQAELRILTNIIEKMELDYCQRATFKDDLLVKLYLNIFLIEIEKLYEFQQDKALSSLSRSNLLVNKFQALVKKHYIKIRQVRQYADMLYVTPHYLNDSVREITGSNASSYINNQLTLGAKELIVQTDNTFAEISAQLLFSNPSYFSKFFKKQTGYTPIEYRKINSNK